MWTGLGCGLGRFTPAPPPNLSFFLKGPQHKRTVASGITIWWWGGSERDGLARCTPLSHHPIIVYVCQWEGWDEHRRRGQSVLRTLCPSLSPHAHTLSPLPECLGFLVCVVCRLQCVCVAKLRGVLQQQLCLSHTPKTQWKHTHTHLHEHERLDPTTFRLLNLLTGGPMTKKRFTSSSSSVYICFPKKVGEILKQ